MTAPDVSCLLVAWNAGPSLLTCVDSLRGAAAHAGFKVQLVVVDNASDDGSCGLLTMEEGDLLITNPVNIGFGAAVAVGLPHVTSDWVMLTNTDLVVADDFFAHVRPALAAAAPAVATLVPEMRFSGASSMVNCRGIAVDRVGVPQEIDAGEPASRPPAATAPLGGSSGCCLLRMTAVERVRGVEPGYFAYLEDVDLALRLRRAGYRAELVADAVAYHEGSAGVGSVSPTKTYLVGRNRRLLFRLEGPTGVRTRLTRLGVELGHVVVSAALSRSTTPLTGRLDALRLRSYTRFVRRSRALRDDRHALPDLVPTVTLRAALRRKARAVAAAGAAHRHGDPGEKHPTGDAR